MTTKQKWLEVILGGLKETPCKCPLCESIDDAFRDLYWAVLEEVDLETCTTKLGRALMEASYWANRRSE